MLRRVPQEANILAALIAWWPERAEVFLSGRPGTALVMTSDPCLATHCTLKPQRDPGEGEALVVRPGFPREKYLANI